MTQVRTVGPGFELTCGETPPCMLMTPSACNIRYGCNVFQVPIQIINLSVKKGGAISSGADQNCNDMSYG